MSGHIMNSSKSMKTNLSKAVNREGNVKRYLRGCAFSREKAGEAGNIIDEGFAVVPKSF